MTKRVSAIDAKNDFGGLLRDVAAEGEIQIFDNGQLVARIVSARERIPGAIERLNAQPIWGEPRVTQADLTLAAQRLRAWSGFDDD
jgi:prevent-host-death family protein